MNTKDDQEPLSESAAGLPEDALNPAQVINDSSGEIGSQEIDRLPIESIGSYARLEELLTDDEKEKTTRPAAES